MRTTKTGFIVLSVLFLSFLGFFQIIEAQNNRNETEMRSLIRRIEIGFDSFRTSISADLRNRSINSADLSQLRDDMRDFSDNLDNFKNRLFQRAAIKNDAEDLLLKASGIEDFVQKNNIGSRAKRDWSNVRGLLDFIADEYQINWDWETGSAVNSSNKTPFPDDEEDDDSSDSNGGWSDSTPRGNRGGNNTSGNNSGNNRNPQFRARLTGTYRLDESRSDNPSEVTNRALQNSRIGNDERNELIKRLESPENLALDVRGRNVTMASSLASQVNFDADGRERTETTGTGETLRVRADLAGERLTITTLSENDNDYSIKFEPTDNGQGLRVTRRISADFLNNPIIVESIYSKTSDSAQFDFQSNPTYGTTGDFAVTNNTAVVALLQNTLSTKTSLDNDRFTMLVQSPQEFRGAIIEGYVSGVNRSGKISGNAKMTFNFQRIRMTDGTIYNFAGTIEGMKTPDGKFVKIDNEGSLKSDSQTKKTAKRAGIGAGIGAIIGAIAGGPKGAIIGATIGGAGGAGTVAVQDKQDLELPVGSEISIRASAPRS